MQLRYHVFTPTTTRKQKRHDEHNDDPHLHRKWQELEPRLMRRLLHDRSDESHRQDRPHRPHLLDTLRLLDRNTKAKTV